MPNPWLVDHLGMPISSDNSIANGDSENALHVALTGSNVIQGSVVSIATGNTAQQLPNVSSKQNVTLIALKGNVGTVYVGASSAVTNTAYMVALDPKDTYDFPITNVNLLWIYGAQGDGVSYVAV